MQFFKLQTNADFDPQTIPDLESPKFQFLNKPTSDLDPHPSHTKFHSLNKTIPDFKTKLNESQTKNPPRTPAFELTREVLDVDASVSCRLPLAPKQ